MANNTYKLQYTGNEIDSKLAAVDGKVSIDEFNNRYDALRLFIDAKDLDIETNVQNLRNELTQTGAEIDLNLQDLRNEVQTSDYANQLKFVSHQ
jgi:hypothetical protein